MSIPVLLTPGTGRFFSGSSYSEEVQHPNFVMLCGMQAFPQCGGGQPIAQERQECASPICGELCYHPRRKAGSREGFCLSRESVSTTSWAVLSPVVTETDAT